MFPVFMMALAATSPHIDLYTMGQGAYIFERYGHAAVCVAFDRQPQLSRCYNYGTTEFDAPGRLTWDFLRGDARFSVSVSSLRQMLSVYRRADRSVWRQRLPLTATQVAAFQAKLEYDAREENRYYVYHHFSNNCTTRIRDTLDDVTDGVLSRYGARPMRRTYRDLGAQGLADYTLARVASDFALGRAADAPITVYDGMFHPDLFREGVAAAYGAEPEAVSVRQGPRFPQTGPTGRHWTALLAALVVAPVVAREWSTRYGRLFLALTGAGLGLIALTLWGLAAISAVAELRWNEALLVFWPSDAALPFFPVRMVRGYARIRILSVVVVSALAAVGLLRQPLFAPLLLPLAVFGVLAWPSTAGTGVARSTRNRSPARLSIEPSGKSRSDGRAGVGGRLRGLLGMTAAEQTDARIP